MKAVCKGTEPSTLARFRSCRPDATWVQMRHDTQFGGQQAYTDVRSRLVDDQGGLCAFCEIEIRDNDPLKCHVEHFHPKSDRTSSRNWALDVAACNAIVPIVPNKHKSTLDLVQNTIGMLNLNCKRLCTERLIILRGIEQDIKYQRKRGVKPAQGLANLAGKYYGSLRWHRFFTTIRKRLDFAAERYLQQINYRC